MSRISRRAVLAALAALTSLPATAAKQKKIAIIGAGMAGLAAARHLAVAGHEVTVLEAKDWIGGRVYTSTEFGFPIEIGANWVHGDKGNPLMKLAKAAGISSFAYDFDDWRTTDADGKTISGPEDAARAKVSEALEEVLGDAADEDFIGKTISDLLDRDRAFAKLKSNSGLVVDAVLRRELSGDYGADADEISAAAGAFGEDYEGHDMLVTNGYSKLADHLAKGLEIRLNEPVTAIAHGENGAEVETGKGKISFDAVIVTVPLGILKAKRIRFEPPLSQKRAEIISRMGFSAFEKAFLLLDKPFDLGALNVSVVSDRPWVNLIDLSSVAGKPAVLAYCGGDDARKTSVSDEENRDWLLANVRAAAGDTSLQAVGFRMSRWLTDVHTMGSYAYPARGSRPEDNQGLGGLESPSLFFAGEACSPYSSTVHGALESGIRVAKQILKG